MTGDLFTKARKVNANARELCMLPIDYDPAHLPPAGRTAIECKWDGIPLIYLGDGKAVNALAWTREGVDFTATSHLWAALDALCDRMRGSFMLHGEYCQPTFEGALSDFRRGAGTGVLWLWDAVPSTVWRGERPSAPAAERRELLAEAMLGLGSNQVGLTPQLIGFDQAGVEASAETFWNEGAEGIVVKDMAAPYIRARSPAWMRLKRRETADCRVLSIELRPGTALLQRIVVDVDGREQRVGVGFTDDQRRRPGDFAPGVVVELNHLGRTGGGMLRSATFARIRGDKA